jgi:hypothetical protein
LLPFPAGGGGRGREVDRLTMERVKAMLKDKVLDELESVRGEIESESDEERMHLEGWEKALLWVLRQIESEAK